MLGKRDRSIYGDQTLEELESMVVKRAQELGAEILAFQSNSEGTLIDFIQAEAPEAAGIIVNPGALTHYGLSLRDALEDSALPVIEVHLSDIHAREEWRRKSVIESITRKQISGKGRQGYIDALDILVAELKESK
ncbi:3-dehydroquinate dehydratase [subsurface metagenome]